MRESRKSKRIRRICQEGTCENMIWELNESFYCETHTRMKYFTAMYHRIVAPRSNALSVSLNEALVCA